MREVDEALELMKEEFKNRMEACEERRMQFELKQAKMREQVLKFEKFIQENDAKRQRAEKKTKEEKKTYEVKCQELNMLNKKIEDMENAQKDLEKQLREILLFLPILPLASYPSSSIAFLPSLCQLGLIISQRERRAIVSIWNNFWMLAMSVMKKSLIS